MNPNLYSPIENNVSIPFSFFNYNIDMAMREEKYEYSKWSARSAKVVSLINSYCPDIICLQELRQLENTDPPRMFLAKHFPAYDCFMARRNPTKLSFYQATLWNTEKFFCVDQKCFWLSDTETILSDSWGKASCGTVGYGYIITATKLQFLKQKDRTVLYVSDSQGDVHDNSNNVTIPSLWIFNTHLGQEEDLKTKSCEKIVDIIKTVTNQFEDHFILCGDFNMFPQFDGFKQYEIFEKNTAFKPIFSYESLCSPHGLSIPGTFLGFSHDPFCAKEPLKQMSHLDHIFVKKMESPKTTLDITNQFVIVTESSKTEKEELDCIHDRDSMPSDHLALYMECVMNISN